MILLKRFDFDLIIRLFDFKEDEVTIGREGQKPELLLPSPLPLGGLLNTQTSSVMVGSSLEAYSALSGSNFVLVIIRLVILRGQFSISDTGEWREERKP